MMLADSGTFWSMSSSGRAERGDNLQQWDRGELRFD
jgi:hypothetical protein